MLNVVYEDNHLLVVEKPPHLLTQGDASGDDSLLDRMKRYIGEKYKKPGAVYLGLVHRMDRPVGGLVALARTSKAAARLSEQLRLHTMQREYLAVVRDDGMPEQGTLCDFLQKDESTGNVRVVPAEASSAQEAVLHFSVLAREKDALTALVHIRLETGRKHQIRVQLAHSGHPIMQDMRYGHGKKGEPIALWGSVLRFTHPTQREAMTFMSKPQGRAFQPYEQAIQSFLKQAAQGGNG